MTNYDIKTVADAAAELARKTTQTMTEASTKAWKDFYAFSDTVAKAQAESFKSLTQGQGYGDFYDSMTKFHTDALKSWNSLFNTTTTSK